MVATGRGLDHLGGAVSLEAGQDERGLHLGTRDTQVVHASDEIAAAHDERRQRAAGATVEAGTHRPQRLDDPRHRTLHQRLVAAEDREEGAAREQAGQQPDARARIPAVDDAFRLDERVDAVAVDDDGTIVLVRGHDAQLRERSARATDVFPARQAGDARPPVGHRGEQQRAMRHPLVAGHAQSSTHQARPGQDHLVGGLARSHTSGVRATW